MQELPTFPQLETNRLRLREIVEADAEDLFAIHGDSALMQWFGSEPLPDLSAAQTLIKTFASWRALPNPGTRWAIEPKDSTGLVGTCGLFSWNRNWRKCVIGYELAIHAQGKGYMAEALKLAVSLGFVEEGCLREVGHWGGQYHDMLQFSLLKREWRHAEADA